MKLSEAEINAALKQMTGWAVKGDKITKQFQFGDFGDAFAFMTRCAIEIEKRDHHPEWFNVYNKINVELTTHDAGGVTDKDIELAGIMDKVAALFLVKK